MKTISTEKFEQALLDSLIDYEYLKPRYYTLLKTNEYLVKENQDYKIKSHLLSLQCENERASFADQLAKEKKKRKKLILLCVIVGMVGGAIIN